MSLNIGIIIILEFKILFIYGTVSPLFDGGWGGVCVSGTWQLKERDSMMMGCFFLVLCLFE